MEKIGAILVVLIVLVLGPRPIAVWLARSLGLAVRRLVRSDETAPELQGHELLTFAAGLVVFVLLVIGGIWLAAALFR